MKKLLFPILSCCFALSWAGAFERFSESFTEPLEGLPNGWKAVKNNEEAIVEISSLGQGVGLLVERPGQTQANAAAYYMGGSEEMPDFQLGDFSLSVVMRFEQRAGNSSTRGVVIRAQRPVYSKNQGYYIAFEPVGESRSLSIYWNPNSHVENGEALAITPLVEALKPGVDYLLQVRAKGSTIHASLWSTDATGNKDEEIVSVTTDEATHAAVGYLGLRGAYGNSGPVRTWFRALHIQTGAD